MMNSTGAMIGRKVRKVLKRANSLAIVAMITLAGLSLLASSASADVVDIYGTVDVKAQREVEGYGGSPQQPTGPWTPSSRWYNATGADVYGMGGLWWVEEYRWAIEFDLELIPDGATISSVQLGLGTAANYLADQISVGGYVGDGLGDMSDIVAGSEVFSYSPPMYTVVWNDVTAFVDGLVENGDQYAGFNFQQLPLDLDPNASAAGWYGMDADTPPILQVEYVPEPATLSLLALGGLLVIRRRR